jgi:O-antigen ligase
LKSLGSLYVKRQSKPFRVPKVLLTNKPLPILIMAFFSYFCGLMTGGNAIGAIGYLILPYCVLMFYNPVYAFHLYVASLPLYVVSAQVISASIPRLAGFVLFGAWLPYVFFTGKFKFFRWNRALVIVTVFFGWMLISILWSMYVEQGLIRLRTVSQLFLAIIIGITLIDKKDKFYQVIAIVILTCTIAGFRSFYISLVTTGRSVGIEGFDQNEFASMLLIPLMITFSLYNQQKSKLLTLLFLICMFGCFLGALSTVSRGFVVSVLGSFTALMVMEKNRKKMVILLLIAILISSPYYIKRYGERLGTEQFELTRAAEAPMGRIGIWVIGFEIFKNHPVIGVGIGGFAAAFNVELEKDPARIIFYSYGRVAHNDYLQILTELGIVGLLLWIVFITEIFKKGFRTKVILERLKETYLAAIIRGLISGLFGLMIASFFLGLYYSKFMWLTIMMFLLLGQITKNIKHQSDDPSITSLPDP